MEILSTDLQLGCDEDSVLLEASVNGGLGAVSITWGNGDTGENAFVSGLDDRVYLITGTDECPRSTSMSVSVNSGCGINVPNVITPNNDGHNDAWVIDGLYRSKHTVTVFNRWGQVVFESSNYNNTWRASGVPDGTYFYEIISDRSKEPVIGTLTILGNGR